MPNSYKIEHSLDSVHMPLRGLDCYQQWAPILAHSYMGYYNCLSRDKNGFESRMSRQYYLSTLSIYYHFVDKNYLGVAQFGRARALGA